MMGSAASVSQQLLRLSDLPESRRSEAAAFLAFHAKACGSCAPGSVSSCWVERAARPLCEAARLALLFALRIRMHPPPKDEDWICQCCHNGLMFLVRVMR